MRKSFFKLSLGVFLITFLIGAEGFSAFLKFDSKKWSAYTSFGYLFDNNISLNPTQNRRDASLTHQQGNAFAAQVKPTYTTPFKNWGMVSLTNSFFGQWHWDAYQRRYNVWEYALTPKFTTSSMLWGKEVFWTLPFTYAAIFSGAQRSTRIAQIYNTYDFFPSWTYVHSAKCDTTLDANIGVQDSKNGAGITNRDGRHYNVGFGQGFRLSVKNLDMDWNGGYHYDRLNTKGSQFDERSHIYHLKTAFPFFFKTSMGLGIEFVGKRFLQHTRSFREHGQNYDVSFVKICPNSIGVSLNTRIAKWTARPSNINYNQVAVLANMFYTF
ncbi:MAG: hypothetical protein HYY61_06595 [Deltaproteobacteria bacterium]|nr:hypothetical protein [Deltaproteobacteria bacterium]